MRPFFQAAPKVSCFLELIATGKSHCQEKLGFAIVKSPMDHAMPTLYFSQRLESLVDCLIKQMELEDVPPLSTRVILVPNSYLKQWLLLEIAKRKGISMGLKILTVQEGILPSSFEMTFLIYTALKECKDAELHSFLAGKQRRLIELSEHLASLFFKYGQYEFEKKGSGWQEEVLHKVVLPENPPFKGPVHCFGIDYLPPTLWKLLFRSHPLSIYLFSPCQFFWDDTATDKERKKLLRKQPKIRSELETYLQEAPPLLANWGKLGRETLKFLGQFDFQTEEAYLDTEETSLLKKIQNDLLYFRRSEKPPADDSIQVSLTGSTRLREVEVLRDQICHLASKGIAFQEMTVLAPNLEPYIPFIEFVFAEIPFRIHGVNVGMQSSFFQGLSRLIQLGLGRWDVEDLLILFETPAFYRKQELEEEQLHQFRTWISKAGIKWGFEETQGQMSWETGLDRFLEDLIFLFPNQQRLEVNSEDFEQFLLLFFSLKQDLSHFAKGEQTLSFWAEHLESLAATYLIADVSDEADGAAYRSFQSLIQNLRQAERGQLFPFNLVERFLNQPCFGQIHGSHLHAVRIASIEEGALLSAKALFILGMDEESYPRYRTPSSLDLLKKEAIPDSSDRDRYLFLQALFSATDYLRISYGHLSADEGKPMAPSPLVQELLNSIDGSVTVTYPSLPFDVRCFTENLSSNASDYRTAKAFYGPKRKLPFWPDFAKCPELLLPEGEVTIAISDLAAFVRHPWKFYLQKTHGMFLKDSREESFALQRAQLLRGSLDVPVGLLGKALQLEVAETLAEWEDLRKTWNIDEIFSLHFRESTSTRKWDGDRLELPPLEIHWEKLTVRLIGEIRNVSKEGLLTIGEDNIRTLLRTWPEALIAAISLQAPQVFLLKAGKAKALNNVEESLKTLLEYFFLPTVSPLIPDWADALLRKGAEEMGKEAAFEDPIVDWVLARAEMASAEKIYEVWSPFLRKSFAHLIELYPTRSKKGESHAAV